MADQTDSGGFLPGLLSFFKPVDYSAMYTGSLLKDPATGQMDPAVQQAFRSRALGAAAEAFAQGGMPVPYKGGVPFGATLGHAGAAATTAGDSLIDARMKAAQTTLALANAGNAQATAMVLQGILEGNKNRPGAGGPGSGGGAGTGTGGASVAGGPQTGPAKILASQGAYSPAQAYNFLQQNGATKNEATMLASAVGAESGGDPNAPHDAATLAARGLPPGYGLFGHNATRLTDMRTFAGVGPNDPVPPEKQLLFALQELRGSESKAGAMVNAATTPEQLTEAQMEYERPNRKQNNGNYDQRLQITRDLWNNPPGTPTQTAAATPDPANPYAGGSGQGVYVPPGGTQQRDIQTGLPVNPATGQPAAGAGPAAPPMAPPASAPQGLLNLPQVPNAAAQMAAPGGPGPAPAPPGAPTPGPQGLLGPQPGGAAPGPVMAAIEAGRQRAAAAGGPPGVQVAGPGAGEPPGPNLVPGGGAALPPQPPVTVGPPSGVGGLLNQPPAGPPAPPAGGPPAPVVPPPGAPGPVPPQAAPAPPPAPAANIPPPPVPPTPPPPPQIPPDLTGQHSNAEVEWAKKQAALYAAVHLTPPPDVAALATLDTDMAKEAQKQQLDNIFKQQQADYQAKLNDYNEAMKQYRAYQYAGPTAGSTEAAKQPYQFNQNQNKALWDIYVAQNKPRDPQRAGTFSFNPATGQYTMNRETVEADGSTHQHITTLNPQMQVLGDFDAGPTKASPGSVSTQQAMAGANVKDFETVQKEASGAAQTLAQARNMREAAPNFPTGVGAGERQFMNRVLVTLGMGGDDATKSAASYESFIKDAGQLARSQASAITSRVGVQELQNVAASLAAPTTTPRGIDRTLAQIQGVADYKMIKQQAMTGYMADPAHAGSNAGFEADFNKNISPYTYMYMRLSDQDRADLRNQLSQTPGGRADLQRLQGQINYIQGNNLMPVQ